MGERGGRRAVIKALSDQSLPWFITECFSATELLLFAVTSGLLAPRPGLGKLGQDVCGPCPTNLLSKTMRAITIIRISDRAYYFISNWNPKTGRNKCLPGWQPFEPAIYSGYGTVHHDRYKNTRLHRFHPAI